jgi:hypothetical protein
MSGDVFVLTAGDDIYLFSDKAIRDGQEVACIAANLDTNCYWKTGESFDLAAIKAVADEFGLEIHDYRDLSNQR